jgi:hypothetical protein
VRRLLRVAAALIAAVVLAGWWMGGAHRGWSQTSVAIEKTDEVTGLSYRDYERRFVPGLELLGAGLGLAVLVGLASFLAKSKAKTS